MNLFKQTQLEIQELEMRANAIKAMMEKSKSRRSIEKNDEKSDDKNETKNSPKDKFLLDNIDSDDDYLSDEEEDEKIKKDSIKELSKKSK